MKNYKKIKSSDNKIIAFCITLSIAIFIFDSFVELGVAGGVPHILVVLVSLRSSRKKMPIYIALLGSTLTLAGFYASPYGGELWKVILNRLIALFAIWTTAILGIQKRTILVEKEKALGDLKILSGLLPICASCKKIRDEKGYWKQIETYIQNHSEAEFTHSICQKCAKELYPDLVDENGNFEQES